MVEVGIKPELVISIISILITVGGFYFVFRDRVRNAENRMTIIEKDIETLADKTRHNSQRLDEHDGQNKIMFQLVEQTKMLTVTVNELKQDIKDLRKEIDYDKN